MEVELKTGKGARSGFEDFRIMCLHLDIVGLAQLLLPHGNCQVRSPLKHSNLPGRFRGFLKNLNRAGTRAYDRDALVIHVQAILRPVRGMVGDAAKRVPPRKIGDHRL